MVRPLIAVPGRFSASASALRFGALVNARKLLEAVYRAGGDPLTVLPSSDVNDVADRLRWADGVLLPGGGDLDPTHYGQTRSSEHLYDLDAEQDAFDLAVAEWAGERGVPVLAVCRGLHVVNVARGGELEQHMDEPHRHVTQSIRASHPTLVRAIGEAEVVISCYHHQRISRLAAGLVPAALAADGTVEAVVDADPRGWFLGVQWHPEDSAETDPAQQALFDQFVGAARSSAGGRLGLQRHDDLAER
jgi:putative glutamine amidotransferase